MSTQTQLEFIASKVIVSMKKNIAVTDVVMTLQVPAKVVSCLRSYHVDYMTIFEQQPRHMINQFMIPMI